MDEKCKKAAMRIKEAKIKRRKDPDEPIVPIHEQISTLEDKLDKLKTNVNDLKNHRNLELRTQSYNIS